MLHLMNHLIVTVLTLSPWRYLVNLAIAVTGRALDILSTLYVTPTLEEELNPIVKRTGWKWWILLNIVVCAIFAFWFNPSLMLSVMGVLAASHNINQLWVVHMTKGQKELKTYRELEEKVNPKIACISDISYEVAICLIGGVIIIYLVGLDLSKTLSWIGFALIGHAFALGFYLHLKSKNVDKTG